jgi:hypothetical protein
MRIALITGSGITAKPRAWVRKPVDYQILAKAIDRLVAGGWERPTLLENVIGRSRPANPIGQY